MSSMVSKNNNIKVSGNNNINSMEHSFLSHLAHRWAGVIEMIFVSEPRALKPINLFYLSIMAYAEQKNNSTLLAKSLLKLAKQVEEKLCVKYSQDVVDQLVHDTQLACRSSFINFKFASSLFSRKAKEPACIPDGFVYTTPSS